MGEWRDGINFHIHLIVSKFSRVHKVHFFNLQGIVSGGKCQATQSVTASTPLLDDGQDLIFYNASQGYPCRTNTYIGTPVNHTLWCALY